MSIASRALLEANLPICAVGGSTGFGFGRDNNRDVVQTLCLCCIGGPVALFRARCTYPIRVRFELVSPALSLLRWGADDPLDLWYVGVRSSCQQNRAVSS